MAHNFTSTIIFNGKQHVVIIVPSLLQDGMHYEVNIPGFPRFWMRWGVMDRYEVIRPKNIQLPDPLVLAVSDIIEANQS